MKIAEKKDMKKGLSEAYIRILIPPMAVVANILRSSGYKMYLSHTDEVHLGSWKATEVLNFDKSSQKQ